MCSAQKRQILLQASLLGNLLLRCWQWYGMLKVCAVILCGIGSGYESHWCFHTILLVLTCEILFSCQVVWKYKLPFYYRQFPMNNDLLQLLNLSILNNLLCEDKEPNQLKVPCRGMFWLGKEIAWIVCRFSDLPGIGVKECWSHMLIVVHLFFCRKNERG